MSSESARSLASRYLKKVHERDVVEVTAFRRVKEPRLRFDRTAVGFVRRLRATIAKIVPEGKTLVVTITAPIRQDSKTGLVLGDRIRRLLATKRTQLKAKIHGNRIQAHVLAGGSSRTSRVIGFVHNPEPDPTALLKVTRALLACIGSSKRSPKGIRWLIVDNQDGLAPVETVRQVCVALRARNVFKRILLVESGSVKVL
jgi:hypothetical protein